MILCWLWQSTPQRSRSSAWENNKLAFKLVLFFLSHKKFANKTSPLNWPVKNLSPSIHLYLSPVVLQFFLISWRFMFRCPVPVSSSYRRFLASRRFSSFLPRLSPFPGLGPRCEANGSFNWKSLLARQSCSLKRPARRPTGMGGDTWWPWLWQWLPCGNVWEMYGKYIHP